MVRQFWLDQPENFPNKRNIWEVVQSLQPKYLDAKCAYHLQFFTAILELWSRRTRHFR